MAFRHHLPDNTPAESADPATAAQLTDAERDALEQE
jgi:hypothetical protein